MPATDYSKWDKFDVSDSDEDEGAAAKSAAPPPPTQQQQKEAQKQHANERLERMQKVELLGEEVLTDRQQIVELDRRRNKNREALAALRRIEREKGAEVAATQKHWVCMGETFTKYDQTSARSMLEADQKRLDAEIDRLRDEVKRKTSEVCKLDPSIANGSDIHRSFVDLRDD